MNVGSPEWFADWKDEIDRGSRQLKWIIAGIAVVLVVTVAGGIAATFTL